MKECSMYWKPKVIYRFNLEDEYAIAKGGYRDVGNGSKTQCNFSALQKTGSTLLFSDIFGTLDIICKFFFV